MSERVEAIAAVIEPALADLGLELFDLQLTGSGRTRTLRVLVDREGGVDLDGITAASERISPLLDGRDDLRGPFALEVSSPGIERPLRAPLHFRRAVGETVSVKVRTAGEDVRRVRGVLSSADDDGIVVAGEPVPYGEIVQARTVFEWGPAPKPGKGAHRGGNPRPGRRRKEKTSR